MTSGIVFPSSVPPKHIKLGQRQSTGSRQFPISQYEELTLYHAV